MHGCGNDFIIFDPGEVEGFELPELARKVCARHFGVGADGILIPAASDTADLKMIYLNSDGSPSEMCGNGIRCLARYTRDFKIFEDDALTIETGAGVKKIWLREDGSSRVDMGEPELLGEIDVRGFRFTRVSMGNPHAVTFLGTEEALGALDLRETGAPIERDSAFPQKTNVEFACGRGTDEVRMRIWERGSGETLASGSGSCAVAVATMHHGLALSPVRVILDGGSVEIDWAGDGEPVYMSGPAEYVCEGDLLL